MLNHTLYQIEEFSDIWADACLRDSEGRLMFLSVYGRDGVLMQMLAAFELGASQRASIRFTWSARMANATVLMWVM